MNLLIRPAGPADATVVADFNARLALESEGKSLDPAVLRRGVERVLGDGHKGFYTLAVSGGEVVGQTLVTFEWSDWRDGWYWWVQSVYVRADWRRRGVFRLLFQHLRQRAEADPDVIGLRLYVENENAAAQRTYAGLGLEVEPYKLMGLYPLRGANAPGERGASAP